MDFDLDETMEIAGETFALSKIQHVQMALAKYKKQVANMKEKAESFLITDQETNIRAVEMSGQAQALYKLLEKMRKKDQEKEAEFIKSVNQFYKPFTSDLESIPKTLGPKITRYDQEQTKARLEAQRKANEEAARLQDEINNAAEAAQEQPQVVVLPVVMEASKITRTASGSATQTTTWAHEVVDFALLPDQYKVADTVGLNKAVKSGIRQIPGVNIYETQNTRIRAASLPQFDNLEQF